MREAKIQTGLRIPQARYEEIVNLSEQSGASINTVLLMLMEIGWRVIQPEGLEAARALLHSPQDTA